MKFRIFILLFISLCKASLCIEKKDDSDTRELEYKYLIIEALRHKYIGNLNSSVKLFRNALFLNDSSAISYFELANISLMQNDLNKALEFSKLAIQYDPENLWYKLQNGQILIALKKFNEAEIIFKDLSNYVPDKLEFKYQLANIYIQQKNYDEAIIIYNNIDKNFGFIDENILYKHNLYLLLNDFESAINTANSLLQNNPERFEYLQLLGDTYYLKGDTNNAIQIYKQVLEYVPDDSYTLANLGEIYLEKDSIEQFISILKSFYLSKNIPITDKINYYVEISKNTNEFKKHKNELKLIFKDFNLLYNTIDSKRLYADFLLRNLFYEDAISEIKSLIEINSNDQRYWEQLLNIYNFNNEIDSLVLYSQMAVNLFPSESKFYLFNGIGNIQIEKFILAEETLIKGLKLINKNSEYLRFDYYVYLGDVYHRLLNYKKSDFYFKSALELDSTNLLVLNNYSYYLSLREENLLNAQQMSYKTILNDSLNSTYLDTYAWVLYKLGNYIEAKHYIEKAIKFGGNNNFEIIDHYGDILIKMGFKKEAFKYWERAIDLGGDAKIIKNKIHINK